MLLKGNNEKETKLCNRGGSRGRVQGVHTPVGGGITGVGAGGAHPLSPTPPPPTRGPAAFEIAFGAQRNESMPIRR